MAWGCRWCLVGPGEKEQPLLWVMSTFDTASRPDLAWLPSAGPSSPPHWQHGPLPTSACPRNTAWLDVACYCLGVSSTFQLTPSSLLLEVLTAFTCLSLQLDLGRRVDQKSILSPVPLELGFCNQHNSGMQLSSVDKEGLRWVKSAAMIHADPGILGRKCSVSPLF